MTLLTRFLRWWLQPEMDVLLHETDLENFPTVKPQPVTTPTPPPIPEPEVNVSLYRATPPQYDGLHHRWYFNLMAETDIALFVRDLPFVLCAARNAYNGLWTVHFDPSAVGDQDSAYEAYNAIRVSVEAHLHPPPEDDYGLPLWKAFIDTLDFGSAQEAL